MIEDEKRSLVFGHVWCNDSDVQPRDYIKEECRNVHILVGRLSVFIRCRSFALAVNHGPCTQL